MQHPVFPDFEAVCFLAQLVQSRQFFNILPRCCLTRKVRPFIWYALTFLERRFVYYNQISTAHWGIWNNQIMQLRKRKNCHPTCIVTVCNCVTSWSCFVCFFQLCKSMRHSENICRKQVSWRPVWALQYRCRPCHRLWIQNWVHVQFQMLPLHVKNRWSLWKLHLGGWTLTQRMTGWHRREKLANLYWGIKLFVFCFYWISSVENHY